MPSSRHDSITAALTKAGRGDPRAASRLLSLAYRELKRMAAARLARLPPGGSLEPTVLAHDAYLRLIGNGTAEYENRRHFFFAAARAMRDLIAEHERRKTRLKRDGGRRISLRTRHLVQQPPREALFDLDRALGRLKHLHPEWAKVVALRFYTGLSSGQTAEVLGVSLRTAERRWTCARAWLRKALAGGTQAVSPG